jgi:hypothetical protein
MFPPLFLQSSFALVHFFVEDCRQTRTYPGPGPTDVPERSSDKSGVALRTRVATARRGASGTPSARPLPRQFVIYERSTLAGRSAGRTVEVGYPGCTIVAQMAPNRIILPNWRCNFPNVSCWFRTPGVWNRVIAKPLYGLTPVPRVRIPPSPPFSLNSREISPSLTPKHPKHARIS